MAQSTRQTFGVPSQGVLIESSDKIVRLSEARYAYEARRQDQRKRGRHMERVASLDDGAFEGFMQASDVPRGVMATRESNITMFPQSVVDPERKEDVRIAKQSLEKIDGLIMKGLRRELAAAEARALTGDAGAAWDAELLFLSIRHRLRDHDALGVTLLKYVLARAALDF